MGRTHRCNRVGHRSTTIRRAAGYTDRFRLERQRALWPASVSNGNSPWAGKDSRESQIRADTRFAVFGYFFGVTPATGQFAVSQLEAATVPATTPYTVIPANAASYNDDLGVAYAGSGKRFNRVTTPAAAGQYSVNFSAGVYTFSAADANAALLISYTYNVTTSGSKLTITNQLMGATPTFKATFYTTYNGNGTALRLNACTANKLSFPTKVDTWTINELDFSAFADASGTIGYLS